MSEYTKRIAVRACAEWLSACLGFGWRKRDLNFLEALWWKYHDPETGQLTSDLADGSSQATPKDES